MKVTAIFLGSQHTLSFIVGQQYSLTVGDVGRYLQVSNDEWPFQRVPYSSWKTFLDCWGNINKVTVAAPAAAVAREGV